MLSNIGTVIGLQTGPLTDQFFLTFDKLGSQTNVVVEAIPADAGARAGAGGRRHRRAHLRADQLDPVGAHRACRPPTRTSVATYLAVQQQLPPIPTLEGFSSANQVGVAQLAIQYCNEMVNTPAYLAQMLPGVTLSAGLFPSQAGMDSVTGPLAAKVLGNGSHQPAASTMTGLIAARARHRRARRT